MDNIKRDIGLIRNKVNNISRRVSEVRKIQNLINKQITQDIKNLSSACFNLSERMKDIETRIERIEQAMIAPTRIIGFTTDQEEDTEESDE